MSPFSSPGSITDSYDFRAYGETFASTVVATNVFRWVGELGYYLDIDRLAYYLRARPYSPSLARFLSHDPIGFVASQWNLYEYVYGDPARYTDPNGLIFGFPGSWSDYWYYLTNPDEMDEDLQKVDRAAKEVAITCGTTAVGLRGAAELSRVRHLRILNQNRYLRIGPGRMGGPTKTPRLSIGPDKPGQPPWLKKIRHVDLRVRPIDKF